MLLDEKDQIASLLSIYQALRWWVGEDDVLITQGHPNPKDHDIYQVVKEMMKKERRSDGGG